MDAMNRSAMERLSVAALQLEEGKFDARHDYKAALRELRELRGAAPTDEPEPNTDANRLIARLLARIDELEAAGRVLRDDLIARARFDDDAKTVCAGRGAWEDFCAALEAMEGEDG